MQNACLIEHVHNMLRVVNDEHGLLLLGSSVRCPSARPDELYGSMTFSNGRGKHLTIDNIRSTTRNTFKLL